MEYVTKEQVQKRIETIEAMKTNDLDLFSEGRNHGLDLALIILNGLADCSRDFEMVKLIEN